MSQAELSTCSAPQTQRIFQEAVRKGNTQELQSLLQNMTNCEFNVNSFGPEGQTALHQSVIDGNLELVKLLVKFGADIRLANRDGWSALHIAAFGGHQDIVLYLITKAKIIRASRGVLPDHPTEPRASAEGARDGQGSDGPVELHWRCRLFRLPPHPTRFQRKHLF
ncbi:Notch-regulated ankyrin repeat-containing protein [Pteropus alecto]|uniref:Notch-regulated ankyrin repeat-containing protein n=1 Tax=Pteropus alecto TaxID=9402 RepID=L5K7V5_PTEAL|nr:Notch-regulated ankyrin repeat-containing protein [Pteropus alecto]